MLEHQGPLSYLSVAGADRQVNKSYQNKKAGASMELDQGILLQIVMYIITAAATVSTVLWRIKELEKKVEKHNGLVERMVVVEQSCKSAHHRIDHVEEVRA